jgi:hypothetical protein
MCVSHLRFVKGSFAEFRSRIHNRFKAFQLYVPKGYAAPKVSCCHSHSGEDIKLDTVKGPW